MTTIALVFALIATPNTGDSNEPTLLDFHASWCGPCQQMRPAIRILADKGYPIRSIDVDKSPNLAARYKVKGVPAYIVVDSSGRELARTEGLQPASQLASFYRAARTKANPPANSNAHAAADEGDPDSGADEDAEAETEETATTEEVADSRPRNPHPWETVVRIKIQGNGMIGFGSGTIIHSTPEQSIILTCAHIFKMEGHRPVPPSKFPLKIAIDLFDGKLGGPSGQQVHPTETVDGEAIDYDFDRDVGLIRIRPGRRLLASRVVPPTWVPRTQEKMTTVGCSLGQDATAWSTSILNPTVRGLTGNATYEAIECKSAPKQGRSGGGLYTKEGYVAGVCDFAEPRGDVGLYATPRSIYSILDRNRLTALYKPGAAIGGPVLAKNRPRSRPKTSPATVRAQSQDPEDEVTIPDPERLGINPPSVAQNQNQTRSTAIGHGWISPKSLPAEEGEAESTDLKLSKSADNNPFDDEPVRRTPSDEEDRDAPTSSAPIGRWKAVQVLPTEPDDAQPVVANPKRR